MTSIHRTQASEYISPRRRAPSDWAEALLLAVLAGIFVWRAFIPGWKSLNTDFPNYYVTARLYRQGYSLTRAYDWIWFQREKDHLGIERRVVGFVPLTLLSALPVYPFAAFPPLTAKHYWMATNLLLLCLTGWLTHCMTAVGLRRIAILFFLALDPLRTSFLYGQMHIAVLLLLAISAWLYFKGHSASAGGALALASALKIYPFLFVFFFLRKKQWRAMAGLIGGTLALAALSIYLFGIEANRTYVQEILPRIAHGENVDPYNAGWDSMPALLHRIFIFEPDLNPHPLWASRAAYSFFHSGFQALLFTVCLWLLSSLRSETSTEMLEWGTYVAFLLALSTTPASYHFCALILSAVLAMDYLLSKGRRWLALAFVAIYGLACLPWQRFHSWPLEGWRIFLAFPRLYFTLALLGLLFMILAISSPRAWTARFQTREAGGIVLVFVALASTGAFFTWRHVKSQVGDYNSRLAVAPTSLMLAEPAASGDEILFTALRSPSYVLGGWNDGRTTYFNFNQDAFHPTLLGPSAIWVELAGSTSRIVKLTTKPNSPIGQAGETVVENGEQPTVSSNGIWLAYTRESAGRSSLWLKNLQTEIDQAPGSPEEELVGNEYDVLEATFDPKLQHLVFSAHPRRELALFSVEISSHLIRPLSIGPPERYPTFSADGKWFAWTRQEGKYWHLWIRGVPSGIERRISEGECNSASPAWLQDSKSLVYATDCGRGVGMTALARVQIAP